jgi:hypothetical protein
MIGKPPVGEPNIGLDFQAAKARLFEWRHETKNQFRACDGPAGGW